MRKVVSTGLPAHGSDLQGDRRGMGGAAEKCERQVLDDPGSTDPARFLRGVPHVDTAHFDSAIDAFRLGPHHFRAKVTGTGIHQAMARVSSSFHVVA